MRFSMSAIIYWQNPCKLPMSFRCIKAYMLAFSGRFSRKCLEGISFKLFVCFIFHWSIGSAPKKKTSISNVTPKLKYNASLIRISCQCLITIPNPHSHHLHQVYRERTNEGRHASYFITNPPTTTSSIPLPYIVIVCSK